MRLPLAITCLAALALPAAASAAPSTFTVSEARSASVAELAEHVLGATGQLVREVSRPPAEPFPGQPSGLRMLRFATAPRASRSPGLCVADIYFVSFAPAPGAREDDLDPPSFITELSTGRVYKIVGDPTPLPGEWTEDDTRRLTALCTASAGPVLGQSNEARNGFFNGSNGAGGFWETHAAAAAQALHELSRRARTGSPLQIICSPDFGVREDRLCANPQALLAEIDARTLGYVQFEDCRYRRGIRCINLSFARWLDSLGSQRQITISIETDQPTSSQGSKIGEIGTVRIDGHTIVY